MDTLTRPIRESAFHKLEPPPPRMLKGTPLGTNILVKKIEHVDTGLIATPETARRDTGEAEVLAIGGDIYELAVGDNILIRKYAGVGTEMTHDGATYLLIDISEVLMKL